MNQYFNKIWENCQIQFTHTSVRITDSRRTAIPSPHDHVTTLRLSLVNGNGKLSV
ncbi:MAG: hypothetical protein ACI87W_001905 [Halieaceae bacterium]|jgi:hypothetical protein